MKTNILKANTRVDPHTFQPHLHIELSWPLEVLQDLKGPAKGTDEYYRIIGESIMTGIEEYEEPILVWNNTFTEEELKEALIKEGVKIWDNMKKPVDKPYLNGIRYDICELAKAKTCQIDDESVEVLAKKIAESGKNFALYGLYIPHYNVKTKMYITNSDEEHEATYINGNMFLGAFGGEVYTDSNGNLKLLSKIRFASW